MNAPFPASRLTCERCSGHGFVNTGLGRLACLECSVAAATWIPASQPPPSELQHPSHSIMCLGAVLFDGSQTHDLVAYWPARDRWTATRMDGMEPADIEVEVSHYQLLPALPSETRKDFPSYAFGELKQEPVSPFEGSKE